MPQTRSEPERKENYEQFIKNLFEARGRDQARRGGPPKTPDFGYIAAKLKEWESGLVLDMACGGGRYEPVLPPYRTVGLDLSLESLRAQRDRKGRSLVNAEVHTMPFREASFDTVFCIAAIGEQVPLNAGVIAEVRRILRPKGSFVFTMALLNVSLISPDFIIHLISAFLRNNRNLLRMLLLRTTKRRAKREMQAGFTVRQFTHLWRRLLIRSVRN